MNMFHTTLVVFGFFLNSPAWEEYEQALIRIVYVTPARKTLLGLIGSSVSGNARNARLKRSCNMSVLLTLFAVLFTGAVGKWLDQS